jgi:hypothetical protein
MSFQLLGRTQDRFREKSFRAPSRPDGMTGLGPSRCDLGILGARYIRPRRFWSEENLPAPAKF